MTADNREGSALDHAVATVRKIRGYWVLATFTLGSIIWFYEAWQDFGPLPDRVSRVERRLQAVERQRDAQGEGRGVGGYPVDALLPGMVSAGRAGERVMAIVPSPVAQVPSCGIHDIEAFITDAAGARRPVAASTLPWRRAVGGIAVSLRLDPQTVPGPAALDLRLTRRCGPLDEASRTTGMAVTVLP
ncbi:MAG: hypothetical protein AAF899_03780 [Pseudomonadota bacterium]